MTNSFNSANQLMVAQGNAQFAELNRLGQVWTTQTTTAITPLAAMPTTTARLEIFNNSNNVGAAFNLEIIDLFCFQLLSTAATQTYAIFAEVAAEAAPTATALSVFSCGGGSPYTAGVGTRIITGVGTTVVANGWRPYGSVQAWGTAAATPGNSWNARVDGALVVPPGSALHLQIVGSVATASSFQALGAQWAEVPIGTGTLANVSR